MCVRVCCGDIGECCAYVCAWVQCGGVCVCCSDIGVLCVCVCVCVLW